MYLDPERVVYNHLGLSRYVKKRFALSCFRQINDLRYIKYEINILLFLDLFPRFGTLAVLDIMLAKRLKENLCPQSIKKMILYKWVGTSHLGWYWCHLHIPRKYLFLVFRCSDKSLVMSHPSKTPIDRPSIPEILSVVRT